MFLYGMIIEATIFFLVDKVKIISRSSLLYNKQEKNIKIPLSLKYSLRPGKNRSLSRDLI